MVGAIIGAVAAIAPSVISLFKKEPKTKEKPAWENPLFIEKSEDSNTQILIIGGIFLLVIIVLAFVLKKK